VPRIRLLFKYWLPILIWMLVIFSASGDSGSFEHTSRIIGPFLHWLFPHISPRATHRIVTAIRKCAHLTEYAILALMVLRALRQPEKNDTRPWWSWREAGFSVLFVAIYAVTDEFHQRFVRSRGPSVHDVLIDISGAIIGLLVFWCFWRWRSKRISASEKPLEEKSST
jgi:VanZ family protein